MHQDAERGEGVGSVCRNSEALPLACRQGSSLMPFFTSCLSLCFQFNKQECELQESTSSDPFILVGGGAEAWTLRSLSLLAWEGSGLGKPGQRGYGRAAVAVRGAPVQESQTGSGHQLRKSLRIDLWLPSSYHLQYYIEVHGTCLCCLPSSRPTSLKYICIP